MRLRNFLKGKVQRIMKLTLAFVLVACLVGSAFAFGAVRGAAALAPSASVASLSILPAFPPQATASTVPANGDVNPYGVAFVPDGFKKGTSSLNPGDILLSNFNNQMN